MGLKMILCGVVICLMIARLASARPNMRRRHRAHNLDRRYRIAPHLTTRGNCDSGPTHSRLAHLWSKLQFHLSMLHNGTLHGVNDSYCQGNNQCLFELQSCGPSIVRIKHVATGLFVAIGKNGKVYTTMNGRKNDTMLVQELLANGFTVFRSTRTHGKRKNSMFLALKKNGATKNASKTSLPHKSSHFTVMLCSGNGGEQTGNSLVC